MKILLLLVLSSCWMPNSIVRAQSPGAEETEELARTGMEHFSAHRYQQALASFQELYEAVPSPQLRFNIAMCHERLGHLTDAVGIYEQALSDGELDDEGRVRAEARLADLRPRLATLVIESDSEHTARIDDARQCEVPCRIQLDPGVHVISAVDSATIEAERVSLAPGQTLRVRLVEPEPARVPEAPTVQQNESWSPGWLFWTGAGLAVAGAGAVVGFGISVLRLEDDFIATPTEQTADRGELMELLANVSIAVAAAGLTGMVLDLFFPSAGTDNAFAIGPGGIAARGRF